MNSNINNRWMVDTTEIPPQYDKRSWNITTYYLCDDYPYYIKFDPEDRENMRDFILELVDYIRDLETENIDFRDDVRALENELTTLYIDFADKLEKAAFMIRYQER